MRPNLLIAALAGFLCVGGALRADEGKDESGKGLGGFPGRGGPPPPYGGYPYPAQTPGNYVTP